MSTAAEVRHIGIFTSGGDSPGMNAAGRNTASMVITIIPQTICKLPVGSCA